VKDFGKPVRDKLSQAGCAFHRRGKGEHDVWITEEEQIASRSTGPIVAALAERGYAVNDRVYKVRFNCNRHAANGILKDAGLPKAF
jgi:hypothetical protein